MKKPEECRSLEDIRCEIDRVDLGIISAIGTRLKYVKAAAKFKVGEMAVKAPERVEVMLEQRKVWAEAEGLDPRLIEKVYRDLVGYFIDEELKELR
ncbi:MAG: isochorismate lyase [Clostridia bacterium]|nr:isochorismate lyase [Clostridia bacterium]